MMSNTSISDMRLHRFVHPDVAHYIDACFSTLVLAMAGARRNPKALRPSGDLMVEWAAPYPYPMLPCPARLNQMVETAVLRRLTDAGVPVVDMMPLPGACNYTIFWSV